MLLYFQMYSKVIQLYTYMSFFFLKILFHHRLHSHWLFFTLHFLPTSIGVLLILPTYFLWLEPIIASPSPLTSHHLASTPDSTLSTLHVALRFIWKCKGDFDPSPFTPSLIGQGRGRPWAKRKDIPLALVLETEPWFCKPTVGTPESHACI